MPWVKIAGTWRDANSGTVGTHRVKIGGVWRSVVLTTLHVEVKNAGTWKNP